MRVGLLLNHESQHQIPHCLPILLQLKKLRPNWDTKILTSNPEQLGEYAGADGSLDKVNLQAASALGHRISSTLNSLGPASRFYNLVANQKIFENFDLLITPERTALLLRHILGSKCPRLIHTKHGSGDRAQGFAPELAKFDLVLVSGEKFVRRLQTEVGVPHDRLAVCGYAKFDLFLQSPPTRKVCFPEKRPTILYNPHPHPRLSSWYSVGLRTLQELINADRFNIIFAPHMMLFRRRVHVGFNPFGVEWVKRVPKRLMDCPHLHVDLGSSASADMSYTKQADIYLGDVSSQVYEFIVTPRPCVFLNPQKLAWEHDPNFLFWSFGSIVSDVGDLVQVVTESTTQFPQYRDSQRAGLNDTFSLTGEASSLRAAKAILKRFEH